MVGFAAMDFRTFSESRDEIDLTAFRLFVIGENANKLSEEIKARNPSLPWIRDMPASNPQTPPLSVAFTLWLSMTPAAGLPSRPSSLPRARGRS
jgi:hypothetical protein